MIYVDNPRCRLILAFMAERGAVQQIEVCARFGWKMDGINNYFSALQEQGLIEAAGREFDAGAKRWRRRYRLTALRLDEALVARLRAQQRKRGPKRRSGAATARHDGSIAVAGRPYRTGLANWY